MLELAGSTVVLFSSDVGGVLAGEQDEGPLDAASWSLLVNRPCTRSRTGSPSRIQAMPVPCVPEPGGVSGDGLGLDTGRLEVGDHRVGKPRGLEVWR